MLTRLEIELREVEPESVSLYGVYLRLNDGEMAFLYLEEPREQRPVALGQLGDHPAIEIAGLLLDVVRLLQQRVAQPSWCSASW